jgi:hypothetical protein
VDACVSDFFERQSVTHQSLKCSNGAHAISNPCNLPVGGVAGFSDQRREQLPGDFRDTSYITIGLFNLLHLTLPGIKPAHAALNEGEA